MLEEFLEANREELIARCRAKAARRAAPGATTVESEFGIPRFLEQLVDAFRRERTPEARARHKASGHGKPTLALVPSEIQRTASLHGHELRRQGLTIDQVVHGYGDLCQSLTELAIEKETPISVDEFHTFNRCLDDAIADAVSSYVEDVDPRTTSAEVRPPSDQSSSQARQMARLIESALQSFTAIQSGTVGTRGTTARLHETSLLGLRDLIASAATDGEDARTRVR